MRKRSFLLAMTLVLLSVLTAFSFVTVGADDTAKTYTFKKTTAEMTLDGAVTEGEEWNAVEWTKMAYSSSTIETGFSAQFKAMWKDENGVKNIYFMIEVTDPSPYTCADTAWQRDGWFAIFKEGDTQQHTVTQTLKDNITNQVTNKTQDSANNLEVTYSLTATGTTTKNYCVEGCYSVTSDTFNFDFMVQNNTSGTSYQRISWNNVDGRDVVPTGIGILADNEETRVTGVNLENSTAGQYTFFKSASNVTLDCKMSDDEIWSYLPWTSIGTVTNGTAQDGYSARFKAMWKEEDGAKNVYFYIEITDPTACTKYYPSSSDGNKWRGDILWIAMQDTSGYASSDKLWLQDQTTQTTIGGSGSTALKVTYTSADTRATNNICVFEGYFTANFDTFNFDIMAQDNYANSTSYMRYAWNNINDAKVASAPTGVGTLSNVALFPVTTTAGASIRVDTANTDKSGIRFKTTVDADAVASLTTAGVTVTTGTILLPTETLSNKGITTLTKENLDEAGLVEGENYYDIVNTGNEWLDGADGTFLGTIFGIKNFNRKYSAVGYAKVTLSDGTTYTIYGGYTAGNARSVSYVATQALADTSVTWSEAEKAVLQNFTGAVTGN